MNTLLIVLVAVVGFCYFGENKCPKVLKDNKEMLLGVLVGMALCSFMGLKIEGFCYHDSDCPRGEVCRHGRGGSSRCVSGDIACESDFDCMTRAGGSRDSKCVEVRGMGYRCRWRPTVYEHEPCTVDADCPSGSSCKQGLGDRYCSRTRQGK